MFDRGYTGVRLCVPCATAYAVDSGVNARGVYGVYCAALLGLFLFLLYVTCRASCTLRYDVDVVQYVAITNAQKVNQDERGRHRISRH